MTKTKKKSLYKRSLLIFTIILLILGISFLVYVYNSLVLYENNLVNNYIDTLIDNGKIASLYNPTFEVNKYESSSDVTKSLNKIYKSDKVSYEEIKSDLENVYSYNIKYNDKVITKLDLEIESVTNRLGLLKINNWEIKNIEYYFDDGFYNYEITLPSTYQLYINNNQVKDGFEEINDSNLERLSQYTTLTKYETIKINNFLTEAKIKILDNDGNKVECNKEDNKISCLKDYETVDYDKLNLKYEFNVLEFAQSWSLFLTDDLGGTLHGFYKLKENLIDDSYMYNMAYSWATGVDITFVSNHSLLNPIFTNESVDKCTIYNDEAFSCVINLEKNMKLTRTGETRVDKMHEELYFVYKDGVYKLVDMKSVETE